MLVKHDQYSSAALEAGVIEFVELKQGYVTFERSTFFILQVKNS